MRTQHYFDAFNAETTERNQGIEKLNTQIRDEKAQLVELNKQYQMLVEQGQDEKADALFDDIEALEKSIKIVTKRVQTKTDVSKKVQRERLIELLMHQTEVKGLYKDDVDKINSELKDAVDNLNKVIDKKNQLQSDFNDEMEHYVLNFEHYGLKEDKEVSKIMRDGGFRTSATRNHDLGLLNINTNTNGKVFIPRNR